MSGWIPTPADGWAEIADALTASGVAWPRSAAITDLRWHADRHDGRVPGRPTLRARWGWPDRAVRSLLADEKAWRDPLKTPRVQRVSSERPARVQPASSPRPASHPKPQGEALAVSSERPADVQPMSSERPADVHTRVDHPHTHTHTHKDIHDPDPGGPVVPVAAGGDPPPSARKGAKASRQHEAFDEVLAIWNERVVPAVGIGAHPRLTHTAGLGRVLDQRLRRYGRDAIAHLLQWYATADDKRAVYLRQEGYALDTLLRPSKIDGYLSLVEAWRKRGMPTATSRQTSAAFTRGANPDDDDPSRAYLRDWRPDPLPGSAR